MKRWKRFQVKWFRREVLVLSYFIPCSKNTVHDFLMQSISPSSHSAAGFESAICHVPVLSVIVLGAAGALSSLPEGRSILKLIRPEVLHNYPFVLLKLLASWHYSHAFWLHSLITWKNGRGKRKGQENLQSVMTEGGKSLFLQNPYK